MKPQRRNQNDLEKWEQVSGWMIAASAVVLGLITVWPVMRPWLETQVQEKVHQALTAQETSREPEVVRLADLTEKDRRFLAQAVADL